MMSLQNPMATAFWLTGFAAWITKEKADLDEWPKELSPSNELRKWFNHDPEKWKECCKKFKAELKDRCS